jgi:hypothetical protein
MAMDRPGAALLPGPLKSNDAYLRHLCAVGWTTMPSGVRKWGPRRGAGRYDYADARAYSHAVGLYRLERFLADRIEPDAPAETEKPTPPPAPSWVDGGSAGGWATDY